MTEKYCPNCFDDGDGPEIELISCDDCEALGYTRIEYSWDDGPIYIECTKCGGSGKNLNDEYRCIDCHEPVNNFLPANELEVAA